MNKARELEAGDSSTYRGCAKYKVLEQGKSSAIRHRGSTKMGIRRMKSKDPMQGARGVPHFACMSWRLLI